MAGGYHSGQQRCEAFRTTPRTVGLLQCGESPKHVSWAPTDTVTGLFSLCTARMIYQFHANCHHHRTISFSVSLAFITTYNLVIYLSFLYYQNVNSMGTRAFLSAPCCIT